MDPISQGVFGATAAAVAVRCAGDKELLRPALAAGFVSGLAADLDIFIRSSRDPLLALEYHRHFTHALAFIPLGALLCALVFYPFAKSKLSFMRLFYFCMMGYGSHGFLDACTSYGTQLLWPFSNMRVAWDIIAIVDPLFTFPILAFLILAYRKRAANWGVLALLYAMLYLGLGLVQRERALDQTRELAASRGHQALRVQAKPSLGNLILFRGLYETNEAFYTDGIRVPLWGANKIYQGQSLPKIDGNVLDRIPVGSALEKDVRRFAWFSDDFIVWHPDFGFDGQRGVIGDFRYSMLPTSALPLWGIEVDFERSDIHAPFRNFREAAPNALSELSDMLWGREVVVQ